MITIIGFPRFIVLEMNFKEGPQILSIVFPRIRGIIPMLSLEFQFETLDFSFLELSAKLFKKRVL
ncbi:MAG: hypothetical protein WCD46_12360 [Desulfobacterales bacterium]